MSQSIDTLLQEAYELIEAERYHEAEEALEPLLTEHADEPAVWWLYAHATDDPVKGREAVQRVIDLSPDYPGAQELLSDLEPASTGGIKKLTPPPPPPSSLPGIPTEPDELTSRDEVEEGGNRTLIFGILALLAILILVFLLTQAPSGDPDTTVADLTTPTLEDTPSIVIAATTETEEPVSTTDSTPMSDMTDEPVATQVDVEDTPQATADSSTANGEDGNRIEILTNELSDFTLGSDGIHLEDLADGPSVLVDICASIRENASEALAEAMPIIAQQAESFDDVDYLGVRLQNCEDNTNIRTIIVSRADALAFANDEIDARDFQRAWFPSS